MKSAACYLGRHEKCKGFTEPLPEEPMGFCECSCHEVK